MVRVMVFGSYDLLHEGHKYFFREAKKLGDELIVVVARDKTIEKFKGISPLYNEDKRLREVREISFVNKSVLGYKGNKMKVVEKFMPDIIAIGYDQDSFVSKLKETIKNLKWKIKLVKIDSYKPNKFKSSLLKKNYL